MSRRDFLKSLSIVALTSACAFKGGTLLNNNSPKETKEVFEKYNPDPFKGQNSSGFEFSCPLPFDYKLIDELDEINKTYKKSQLKTLYGALPDNSNPLQGFTSSGRGVNERVKSFSDLLSYVNYAKKKGFNFVYLLNSPKPFTGSEYQYYEKAFNELLAKLKSNGILNIKVANQQLLEILKDRKEFNIQASTSFEFTNIRQFENFLETYPRVKIFNLAIDTNRNIPLLKNIKKAFKDVEFELMTDESCMFGCPARISHISCNAFIFPCNKYYNEKNKYKNLFRTNVIYPWNLDYYKSIGYKNFKFMGAPYGMRPNTHSVAFVKNYFEAVERGVEGFKINDFLGMLGIFPLKGDNYTISKDMVKGFPDLNFFIANGDKCSQNCGATCNYCFDCADKLNKVIPL